MKISCSQINIITQANTWRVPTTVYLMSKCCSISIAILKPWFYTFTPIIFILYPQQICFIFFTSVLSMIINITIFLPSLCSYTYICIFVYMCNVYIVGQDPHMKENMYFFFFPSWDDLVNVTNSLSIHFHTKFLFHFLELTNILYVYQIFLVCLVVGLLVGFIFLLQ